MERLITDVTPVSIRETFVKRYCKNYNQLIVDHTMFYLDHCKEHPINLLLKTIKKAAEENDKPECNFAAWQIFNNLDYKEKTIKKTGDWPETFWQKVFHKNVHHEWEETDQENENHFWKLTENIMKELQIYLVKNGWMFEIWKSDTHPYGVFHIYL